MNLDKQVVIDRIEVLENNTIVVRTSTRIYEDDQLLSESFSRSSFQPNSDLTGEDPRIISIANAIWPDL